MIFYYVKIDSAIFKKVGFTIISLLSLTPFVFNHHKVPLCFELNYIPIFWLTQTAVYPVGVSKDCSCFTQISDYNSKDLVQIFTKFVLIIASGHPTSVLNFNWFGVRVCELQIFFF